MKIWESIKAKWRGEHRVNVATRGRVFAKDDSSPLSTPTAVNKQTTMKLVGIKIIRASGQEEVIKHG